MLLQTLVPFTYFYRSRLQKTKDALSVIALDWLPAMLIIYWFLPFTVATFLQCGIAYLAFISLYEIGYWVNDFYSIHWEQKPNQRIAEWSPTTAQTALFVAIRIAAFVSITVYLGQQAEVHWWLFYGALVLFFTLHNVLSDMRYRLFTYFHLAVIRFFAPVFPFLESGEMVIIFAAVLGCYVGYRVLSYGQAKGVFFLKNWQSPRFKIGFHALLLPVNAALAYGLGDGFPLILNGYYLFFWGMVSLRGMFFK